MRERMRRSLDKYLIQMGSLCLMIQNYLTPMLRNFQLEWKGNLSFLSSHVGSILRFPTYYIPCIYLKMFHLLYGGTYHRKKGTLCLLGEILFLQKLKRNIGQDKKLEERLVPLKSFKEGVISWILKKDNLSLEKEVIMSVRVPSLYWSSLWCCFTVEDCFSGSKLHDHVNLLRIHMLKTWFILFFILFLCDGIFYN